MIEYYIMTGVIVLLSVLIFITLGTLKRYHTEQPKRLYLVFMVSVLFILVSFILGSLHHLLTALQRSYAIIPILQYFVFLPLGIVLLIVMILELKEQQHQQG